MGYTQKLPELAVQMNRQRLEHLAGGLITVVKLLNVNGDNDYEELLKMHCLELGNQIELLLEKEKRDQFTVKLGISAAYAFVKTWDNVDTKKQPLLTTILGQIMEVIDRAKH